MRHNALRDDCAQFGHSARLGGQLEVGHGSGGDSPNSRPANILVPNWMIDMPAAFDLTGVSPLNSNALNEAGATSGSVARKHASTMPTTTGAESYVGSVAVETYGCWGEEAQCSVSHLAARLALQLQCSKSTAITNIYIGLTSP